MRSVNLIPAHRRHTADRRRRVKRWCIGGGIYALLLILVCALVQVSQSGERAMATAIAGAGQRLGALQGNVNAARGALARTTAARGALQMLADPPDWSLLLTGLPASAGHETLLREIHLDAQTTGNIAEQPKSFQLHLRGISRTQASVSALIDSLQSLGLFDRVELLRSGREPFGDGSAVAFDAQCVIDGSSGATSDRGNGK